MKCPSARQSGSKCIGLRTLERLCSCSWQRRHLTFVPLSLQLESVDGLLKLLIVSYYSVTRGNSAVNPLSRLLTLPQSEKQERGLLYTPSDIAQQPATWRTTHRLFQEARPELVSFLQQ